MTLYRNKNKEGKSSSKLLALCLILAMLAGTFGGCGKESPKTGGVTGNNDIDVQAEDGSDEEPAAMGRYVETTVDISENASRSHNITALADGRLVILDDGAGQIISADGGVTWETAPIPGIDDMKTFTEENYIFHMAVAPDGTVAVLSVNNAAFEENGAINPALLLAKPDGTVKTFDTLPVQTADSFLYNIYFSPEGELFATEIGAGIIYRVDTEKGTLTKVLTMDWRPDLVRFQGDYLFFLVSGEGISIYDRKEEKWVEDSVLADFMKKNYQGQYFTGANFTVYLATDEDGVLYIAGKGGMYRHVIGGSAMELVIDGALASFSNPSMYLVGIEAFGENAFAALFTGGKVALYRYDPNVSAVPENMITVYSLQEQDAVRQAIAQFQTENPDMFVKYEVGMSGTDAAAREDAIKKLNTELMAGKGPDVIIMDGLPVKSYEEKGILKDLKPHIDSLTGDAVLLPNIVEAFNHGGGVYMMPVSIQLPMVMGRKDEIEDITDYASLADTVETIKTEHPNAKVCSFFSGAAAVRWLLPAAAPSFLEESGSIDEAALKEYLSLTKRMYTVSIEGVSDFTKQSFGWQKENYETDRWAYDNFNSVGDGYTDFMLQEMELDMGMLKDIYGYQHGLSLKYKEGFEDVDMKSFDGMSEGVFEPLVLVGISASSTHQEDAERFFDVMMGTEVQGLLYDGFMVNQAALQSQLSPQWTVLQNSGENLEYDYGKPCGSSSGTYGDGMEYDLVVYLPTKEEFQTLYDLCCKAKTPYVADVVVESVITEAGARYLNDVWSEDEAVQNIKAKLELYMAE